MDDYKVTNIKWDTDGEDVDLPASRIIFRDDCPNEEDIADYLSDTYGWCVISFDVEPF